MNAFTASSASQRPQSLIVKLSLLGNAPGSASPPSNAARITHVGWSGLSSSPSLAALADTTHSGPTSARDTIELDPELCASLAWPEGAQVDLQLITRPVRAVSVSVSPCTADDWELVSSGGNAAFLEDHLLGQLRAARPGGKYPVWVAGGNRIWLRCDATDPPLEESGNGDDAVLVAATTEIFVAPMPRASRVPKSSGDTSAAGVAKSAANAPTDERQTKPMSSLDQAMKRLKTGTSAEKTGAGPITSHASDVSSHTSNPNNSSATAGRTPPTRQLRSIPLRVFRKWPELVEALNACLTQTSRTNQPARPLTGWVARRTMTELEREQAGPAQRGASRKVEDRVLQCELEIPEELIRPRDDDADGGEQGVPNRRVQVELRILPGVPNGQVFMWPTIDQEMSGGAFKDEAEQVLLDEWVTFG